MKKKKKERKKLADVFIRGSPGWLFRKFLVEQFFR